MHAWLILIKKSKIKIHKKIIAWRNNLLQIMLACYQTLFLLDLHICESCD